jgi:hypothetical protein
MKWMGKKTFLSRPFLIEKKIGGIQNENENR